MNAPESGVGTPGDLGDPVTKKTWPGRYVGRSVAGRAAGVCCPSPAVPPFWLKSGQRPTTGCPAPAMLPLSGPSGNHKNLGPGVLAT